jgi:hypothetical protein
MALMKDVKFLKASLFYIDGFKINENCKIPDPHGRGSDF